MKRFSNMDRFGSSGVRVIIFVLHGNWSKCVKWVNLGRATFNLARLTNLTNLIVPNYMAPKPLGSKRELYMVPKHLCLQQFMCPKTSISLFFSWNYIYLWWWRDTSPHRCRRRWRAMASLEVEDDPPLLSRKKNSGKKGE